MGKSEAGAALECMPSLINIAKSFRLMILTIN